MVAAPTCRSVGRGDPDHAVLRGLRRVEHAVHAVRRVGDVALALGLDRAGVSPLCQVLDEPAQGFETPFMPAAYRAAQAVEIVKMLVAGGANLDGLNRPLSKLTRLGAALYRPPLSLAAHNAVDTAILSSIPNWVLILFFAAVSFARDREEKESVENV